eukprot:CCRYP_000790-RB/>CCRYP_000790-RB protein AED:0.50 eAED:0.50 QI:0/-1/0/1/-1/0/1/0/5
MKSPN